MLGTRITRNLLSIQLDTHAGVADEVANFLNGGHKFHVGEAFVPLAGDFAAV